MRVEQSNFEDKLQDYQVFDFGTFYFFDGVIVGELNEGITFSYKEAKKFIDVALEYYGPDKNVVYVSNRVNSYSVRPTDWVKINNTLQTLIAVGVVHYSTFSKSIFNIEKLFYKKPFKGFESLEDAFVWAKHIVHKDRAAVIHSGKDK